MSERDKSFFLKQEQVEDRWFVVDAAGKHLGRLATEIATILMGKHRVDYTPGVKCGDGVIVVNCEQVVVTGNKEAQKMYYRYTGHIGGLRQTTYRTMKERKPEFIIQQAVSGMLPKNKLRNYQKKRLRVFSGPSHDMEAQKPIALEL